MIVKDKCCQVLYKSIVWNFLGLHLPTEYYMHAIYAYDIHVHSYERLTFNKVSDDIARKIKVIDESVVLKIVIILEKWKTKKIVHAKEADVDARLGTRNGS